MDKHTIRLTAIIGLGWLCFLASCLDQKLPAKASLLTVTFAPADSTHTYGDPQTAMGGDARSTYSFNTMEDDK
jgi:hypothetical protein